MISKTDICASWDAEFHGFIEYLSACSDKVCPWGDPLEVCLAMLGSYMKKAHISISNYSIPPFQQNMVVLINTEIDWSSLILHGHFEPSGNGHYSPLVHVAWIVGTKVTFFAWALAIHELTWTQSIHRVELVLIFLALMKYVLVSQLFYLHLFLIYLLFFEWLHCICFLLLWWHLANETLTTIFVES